MTTYTNVGHVSYGCDCEHRTVGAAVKCFNKAMRKLRSNPGSQYSYLDWEVVAREPHHRKEGFAYFTTNNRLCNARRLNAKEQSDREYAYND